MRFGLFGTGPWAHMAHAPALTAHKSVDLVGVWGRNPIMPREGYERLKAGLVSGGFVKMGAPFEQAVDNSLAEEVVREDPPALTV